MALPPIAEDESHIRPQTQVKAPSASLDETVFRVKRVASGVGG
jgi:hypothetical protein